MKKKLFLPLILLQLIAIGFLITKIITNSQTLGASVREINTNTITMNPSNDLKYFYEPKPDITYGNDKEWVDYKYTYTINSDSLNERYDYKTQKDPDVFRIVTLGDSFTFGELVDTANNWTEQLETLLAQEKICEKYKKIEVINLGVGGYDTAYEVERYKRRGVKYNPDLVIMLIVDFRRMTDYRIEHRTVYTPEEKEKLRKQGIYRPGYKADDQLSDEVRIQYQLQQYDKLFKLDSRPILIVDHEKHRDGMDMFGYLKDKYPQIEYRTTTFHIVDKQFILPDGHPNIIGHKQIAKDILNHLINSNLIQCK